MSEYEMLMIGIVGGVFGAILIIAVAKFHFLMIIKEYTNAKYFLKESIDMRDLKDEVTKLRIQVAALQSQMGYNE